MPVKTGEVIRADDINKLEKKARNGHITFTFLGFTMGILAILILFGRQEVVVRVAPATVVYEDDEMAAATDDYVRVISELQAGTNATMVADAVNEQIGQLSLQLRKDIATSIADNTDALFWRVMHDIEAVLTPTALPYVGGQTIVPTASPAICDVSLGC